MSIMKYGARLRDLDDWRAKAGPKSKAHWAVNRSAMEAARAWLAVESSSFPAEVAQVLTSHAAFGPVADWSGEPEVRLPFDLLPGEPRNSDLVIHAEDKYGLFVLATKRLVIRLLAHLQPQWSGD
jgi:hypothetical protein